MILRRRVLAWLTLVGVAGAIAACAGGTTTSGGPDSPRSRKGKSATKADSGEETSDEAASEDIPDLPLPKPGVQGEENRSMRAQIDLTLKDETGASAGLLGKNWSLAEDRRVMVETVGDHAVTKYSVLYGQRQVSGLEGWSPLPTEGKGYTIASDGGSVTVLDNGKKPASGEEEKVVLAEYGSVGHPNPLLVAVSQAAANGPQTLKPAAYSLLVGYTPEIDIRRVAITHEGEDSEAGRDVQRLQVDFEGSMADGGITYVFDISGPATVDASTGWVMDLKLAGDLKVSGKLKVKTKQVEALGTGKLEFARTAKLR